MTFPHRLGGETLPSFFKSSAGEMQKPDETIGLGFDSELSMNLVGWSFRFAEQRPFNLTSRSVRMNLDQRVRGYQKEGDVKYQKALFFLITPIVVLLLMMWDVFEGSEHQPSETEKWIARIKKM